MTPKDVESSVVLRLLEKGCLVSRYTTRCGFNKHLLVIFLHLTGVNPSGTC